MVSRVGLDVLGEGKISLALVGIRIPDCSDRSFVTVLTALSWLRYGYVNWLHAVRHPSPCAGVEGGDRL
jgi:hypothetical protein